jgi:hypothetical protein
MKVVDLVKYLVLVASRRKRKRRPRLMIKEYLLPRNGTITIIAEKQ